MSSRVRLKGTGFLRGALKAAMPKLKRAIHQAAKDAAYETTLGDDMPDPGQQITTPAQLATVGRAIFGTDWKSGLAKAAGIQRRSIQRWFTGEYTIPPDLHITLAEVALKRASEISKLAGQLYAGQIPSPKEADHDAQD